VSDGDAWPGSLDAAAGAAQKSGGASSAALLRRAAGAAAAAAGSSGGSSTLLRSALLGDSCSRDAATQGPAAGLDPIHEASASHGSSITDAGASMSSAGIGSSITGVGSSSGNLQGPVGVLALEDAERVEQLLQELMRISLQLKQQGRSISTLVSHAAVLRYAMPRCAIVYGAAPGRLVPCCLWWWQVGRVGWLSPTRPRVLRHLSHARHPQHSSADCINSPSSAAMMQQAHMSICVRKSADQTRCPCKVRCRPHWLTWQRETQVNKGGIICPVHL
jgi:hypothetical protein